MDIKDNHIEWYGGSDTATVTFTQLKYINRIKKLAEKHATCVEILAENPDGSICAHIPLSAIHLTIYEAKSSSFKKNNDDGDDELDV